jgi:ferric-dicitrate binding protein FerR (iron transport regulator)
LKDYRNHSATDFAKDEYFQSWIRRPDPETDVFWRNFRSQFPEQASNIDEAREILSSLAVVEYSMASDDVSALWQRIQEQGKPAQQTASSSRHWYWVAAAAAIILIGSAIPFMLASNDRIQYQTAFGETKTITLSDSSVVILNANSRLSMSADMENQPSRDIDLEGEAYFSVVHKKDNKPFRVITPGGVAVEVLGTSFNVYHREQTKVVLNSGQIQLSLPGSDADEKILMKPGELVEYNQNKNKYSKRVVNPKVYAAWTEQRLILDQTSLREIVAMAKNNYGIEIKVQKESMLDQTVSGSMPIAGAESFVQHAARAFQMNSVKEKNNYLFTE